MHIAEQNARMQAVCIQLRLCMKCRTCDQLKSSVVKHTRNKRNSIHPAIKAGGHGNVCQIWPEAPMA